MSIHSYWDRERLHEAMRRVQDRNVILERQARMNRYITVVCVIGIAVAAAITFWGPK